MIKRVGKNLTVLDGDAPAESVQLERDGCTVLRGVFTPDEVAELRAEIDEVFDAFAAGAGARRQGRVPLRDAQPQRRVPGARSGTRGSSRSIEPLLGDDCHVIANTAWRNPPEFPGGPWHCDAGPHIPRPEGVPWDDRIPYPVFAIGAHILLQDCTLPTGPTAVVPGSHRSGRLAPFDRMNDVDLTYDGRPPVVLDGAAGDVALFVSDAWHRGLPAGRADAAATSCRCTTAGATSRSASARPTWSTTCRPRRSSERRRTTSATSSACTTRSSTTGSGPLTGDRKGRIHRQSPLLRNGMECLAPFCGRLPMGLGQDHIPTSWSAGAPWGISDRPGTAGGSDRAGRPLEMAERLRPPVGRMRAREVPAGEIMGVCRGFQR